MKKLFAFVLTLITALSLCACGSGTAEPAEATPSPAPVESAAPTAEAEPADNSVLEAQTAELTALLDDFGTRIQSGSAGSSLRAVAQAARLMDWGMSTGMTDAQISAAAADYLAALDELDEEKARLVTDDCSLFELTGRPVELVQGDYANIKITTREDLPRTENGGKKMRIGHGYDVHRLVEGRKLILGGVEVPYEKGLLGHSDADVLAHAVMDAVLGAAALGDIGQHFPDTAEEYAGADSLMLARRVAEIMTEHGWRIENIDATILCQRPKLAPYIPVMREKLAAAFGLPVEAVSVKATTEEHLGFTGEGLGIAAHAVALIEAV